MKSDTIAIPLAKRIVIVGGGLAGLAAAVYLARAGLTVTLFERRRHLGGRALTHLRRGFRFNLGPHAVYRSGTASSVYRELGVPVRGGAPKMRGIALLGGERHTLPAPFLPLALSSLLSAGAKVEASKFFLGVRFGDASSLSGMTVRQWLDRDLSDPRLRQTVEALVRLTTYSADAEQQSAEVAFRQLQIARKGVVYVHEGWQKIVDALHSHAVTAGVNFITSSRIVGVHTDGGAVQGVELGELEFDDRMDTMTLALPDTSADGAGTRIPADTVLLAVEPDTVVSLAGDVVDVDVLDPVKLSTLDVALSRLPVPDVTFALGIDRPVYYSAHSQWAQLTPKGGALIHVARYGGDHGHSSEQELAALLDQLQPGWRDVVVHQRYLPNLTVSHALMKPGARRPDVRTKIRGLYLAGDWVGDEGLLSDAALSSARAAARAILADG